MIMMISRSDVMDGWMDFSGKIQLLQRKGVIDDNNSEVDVTFILLCTYERAYSSSFSE